MMNPMKNVSPIIQALVCPRRARKNPWTLLSAGPAGTVGHCSLLEPAPGNTTGIAPPNGAVYETYSKAL